MATTYTVEQRTVDEAVRQAAEMLAIAPEVIVIFYAEGGSYTVRSGADGFERASLDYYADVTRNSGPDARMYLVRAERIA